MNKINHNASSVQEGCVNDASSVELSSGVPIDDILSSVQNELKSQNINGKVGDLKESGSCMSVNDELNVEMNSELNVDIDESLCETEVEIVRSVNWKNYLNKPKVDVKSDDFAMKIVLTSDVPVHQGPRRLSYKERVAVQKKVEELLKEGVIRPSNSPYAATLVPIKKKDGDFRICVDYKGINKLTVRDSFPLPLIENCFEHLVH